MEENEKMKTDVNSNNVNETNQEIKPKSKKLTIVLVIVILLLVLAIGVFAGMLINKENKTVVNNIKQTQNKNEDNQEVENNINQVETENNNEENKEDNENTETNLKNNQSTSSSNGNVLGLDGQFIDIESAAIIKRDIDVFSSERNDIEVDLNNDGKEEKLTISTSNENDGVNCWLLIDDKVIDSHGAWYCIYVVDLDKSDNYIDFITVGEGGSGVSAYEIYKFNGKNYNRVETIYGIDLYVNQNGKIVTDELYFINSNPIIASSYYDYVDCQYVNINISKYSNRLISFKNVDFTDDLKNESRVWGEYDYENENVDFIEHLKQCGITSYENVNAYLLDIVETDTGTKYKVKLEDGTVGYFVGPWAG